MTEEQKVIERIEFAAEDGVAALEALALDEDAVNEAIAALRDAADALNRAYKEVGRC